MSVLVVLDALAHVAARDMRAWSDEELCSAVADAADACAHRADGMLWPSKGDRGLLARVAKGLAATKILTERADRALGKTHGGCGS